MKNIIAAGLVLVFVFCFCGLFVSMNKPHPKSTIVESVETNIMSRVGGNAWADIYVVTIDGKRYIVVNGPRGSAICPAQ